MTAYQGNIKAITDSSGNVCYPITLSSAIFNEDGTRFTGSSGSSDGVSSNLTGKKILFIGDSMSSQFKWQQQLVNRYGIDPTNYKNYSGDGWSIQSVCTQVHGHKHPLDDTKDGVIIFLGTNDAHYIYNLEDNGGSGVSISGYLTGNYDDNESLYLTSFHAATKMLLKTVLTAYVGKPILWVGSPRRVSAFDLPPTGINAKLQSFTDEIKKHCKDYGIKFLDLFNEYNCLTNLGDGIHPRDEMYVQLGNIIGNEFNMMF